MNADQHAVASPFNSRSTATEVLAGVDLSGQTALITGASSGIGVDTAQALAAAGAALILPVRSVEKGEAVAAGIRAAVPGASVHVASMDLGDYASIHRFASSLAAEGKPLNLLINNAGIMACPSAATPRATRARSPPTTLATSCSRPSSRRSCARRARRGWSSSPRSPTASRRSTWAISTSSGATTTSGRLMASRRRPTRSSPWSSIAACAPPASRPSPSTRAGS